MQSEKEFLENYNIEDYERPSVTADVVAFMISRTEEESYRKEPDSRLSLLLVKRSEFPFRSCWALPGGFLKGDESVEECAMREIREEANVTPASLMLVGVFSDPERDPRGRIISNAFASIISENSVSEMGGDDAEDARWFDVSFERKTDGHYQLELKNGDISLNALLAERETKFHRTSFEIIDSGEIAFDHAKMIAAALTSLRSEAESFSGIFDFLPEKFTLTQLQRVQETIMNISVLPANFRRKAAEYVTETDEYTSGAGHRPAKLFKRKE